MDGNDYGGRLPHGTHRDTELPPETGPEAESSQNENDNDYDAIPALSDTDFEHAFEIGIPLGCEEAHIDVDEALYIHQYGETGHVVPTYEPGGPYSAECGMGCDCCSDVEGQPSAEYSQDMHTIGSHRSSVHSHGGQRDAWDDVYDGQQLGSGHGRAPSDLLIAHSKYASHESGIGSENEHEHERQNDKQNDKQRETEGGYPRSLQGSNSTLYHQQNQHLNHHIQSQNGSNEHIDTHSCAGSDCCAHTESDHYGPPTTDGGCTCCYDVNHSFSDLSDHVPCDVGSSQEIDNLSFSGQYEQHGHHDGHAYEHNNENSVIIPVDMGEDQAEQDGYHSHTTDSTINYYEDDAIAIQSAETEPLLDHRNDLGNVDADHACHHDPRADLPQLDTQCINDDSACKTGEFKQGRCGKKKGRFLLAPGYWCSALFSIWITQLFVMIGKTEDLHSYTFELDPTDKSKKNGDELESIYYDIQNGTFKPCENDGRYGGIMFAILSYRYWVRRIAKVLGWTDGYEDNGSIVLVRALKVKFMYNFLMLALWKVLWLLSTWFAAYWLLKWIISIQVEISDPKTPTTFPLKVRGHMFAFVLFLCLSFGGLCLHQLQIRCIRVGVQLRASLNVMVYRKTLKLLFVRGGIADIVNLVVHDSSRVADAAIGYHLLWSSGFQYFLIGAIATINIGMAAVPAVFLIVFVLLPLQLYLARTNSVANQNTTNLFIERTNLMSEIITVIKFIKSYALEDFYASKIEKRRAIEMNSMRKALASRAAIFAVVFVAPVLCLFSCLITAYYLESDIFNAPGIFSLLSLFNTLRYPLLTMPSAFRACAHARISLERLNDFFMLPEVDKETLIEDKKEEDKDLRISIKDADFIWDNEFDEHTHLNSLTADFNKGNLVAVVGDVNSARSFIAAILGQLKLRSGSIHRYGTLGYVPQEPWLLDSSSIRDNIIFGAAFDEQLYKNTIREAGLFKDILQLSNGDETFISDLSLTQQQKQRISLARCLYHQPETILLEDCLSDMDWKHAKQFFKECIKPLTEKHLVIMSVQHKAILRYCDDIVLMRNGKIVDRDSYAGMKARKVPLGLCLDAQTIGDDPSGLIDKVNEIKLESTLPRRFSIFKRASPFTMHSHHQKIVSPLVTAKVLNASHLETDSPHGSPVKSYFDLPHATTTTCEPDNDTVSLASHDAVSEAGSMCSADSLDSTTDNKECPPSMVSHHKNRLGCIDEETYFATSRPAVNKLTEEEMDTQTQSSISRLMSINHHSSQGTYLDEYTVSKLIERDQTALLGQKNVGRAPSNFENSDLVSRTIEANKMNARSLSNVNGTGNTILESLNGTFDDTKIDPYKAYIKEATGYRNGAMILIFFICAHSIRFVSDWWLTRLMPWDNDFEARHIYIYGIFGVGIATAVLSRSALLTFVILKKSVSLHDRIFKALINAPIQYFDHISTSVILSYFARYLFFIDEFLPEAILQILSFLPIILGTTILCATEIPYFVIMIPFYLAAGYYVLKYFIMAQNRLRVLEFKTKTPLYDHLSSTLQGLFTIRTYHVQDLFDGFDRSLMDTNHKSLYAWMLVRSLMCMYLEIICALFVYGTSVFIISFEVPADISGFALSNACQLILFLQWFAKCSGDVNASIGAVTSVITFGEQIPQEHDIAEMSQVDFENMSRSTSYSNTFVPDASQTNSVDSSSDKESLGNDEFTVESEGSDSAIDNSPSLRCIPPKSWPSKGDIEFKHVTLKYNRYGISVLKNVSFHIKPGERIGVVGRSGSGKSTLMAAILRLVEVTDGEIFIDGINVNKVPLKTLRSHIAVIPQEPVLLTGTIRENIDPFDTISDEAIWDVLERVHLAKPIKEMLPDGLATYVSEATRVFSVTERQLLCIGRAIVINSKVVILDEAREFVDAESDALVESVLEDNFKDCTLIVLATRFRLVVQLSKVIVMDRGKLNSFAPPLELLEDPRSKFAKMVNQDSDGNPQLLRELAQRAHDKREGSTKGKLSLMSRIGSSSLSVDPNVSATRFPPTKPTNGETPAPRPESNRKQRMPHTLACIFDKS